MHCSVVQGYAEDYDRILFLRNAAKEKYLDVIQWIEQHYQLN